MAGGALIVNGSYISAFLLVAYYRLTSSVLLDFFQKRRKFRGNRLDKELEESLLCIDAVMDDAEQKQMTDSNVRSWFDEVKDVVLDAEDLLDEIHTEVSMRELQRANTSKVRNYISTLLTSFDRKVESRMKEILDKLESLASKKDALGLQGVARGRIVAPRLPTTSWVDEAEIYGREYDKDCIMKLLLTGDESENNLSVIAVVGTGGIGKTTLAQLVYKDPRIHHVFDLKCWVCVSEEFDATRITRTLLEAITGHTNETIDLYQLQDKLKGILTGKRFLVVLDDVWNVNCVNWEALIHGACGSKILVTTRIMEVARTMPCANWFHLQPLSDEASWVLFRRQALRYGDPCSNSRIEEIGREIIKKCAGLPIALNTIGRLLSTKLSREQQWTDVLKSKMWNLLEEEGSNIIPALTLSYHYLPSHLKRCLAYCSLLPKDYVFNKDCLVQLWMAEGLLEFHQDKSMKELGDECFNALLSRSFFQRLDGERMEFVIHDLVRDLVEFVSGKLCLRLEKDEEAKNASKMTRHFLTTMGDVSKWYKAVSKCEKLRTFLPLRMSSAIPTKISSKTVNDLLSRFKCLRVLSLSCWQNIVELPDSILNLKHLRYLDLSGTRVKKLPDSICLLYNLQTLKLRYCSHLEELPSDMHRLTNLCHSS